MRRVIAGIVGLVGTLALGGCATMLEPTNEEDCVYTMRVGSRIPRRECNGQVGIGNYGEISQQGVQNQTNRMTKVGGN